MVALRVKGRSTTRSSRGLYSVSARAQCQAPGCARSEVGPFASSESHAATATGAIPYRIVL